MTAVLPPDVLTLAAYHYLTSTGKQHSRIVRERRIDECDVTHYSPWMLLATKLQTNIELITHSPSTVFQYLTNGSGGVDSLNAHSVMRVKMWYFVVFRPSKCRNAHIQPQSILIKLIHFPK